MPSPPPNHIPGLRSAHRAPILGRNWDSSQTHSPPSLSLLSAQMARPENGLSASPSQQPDPETLPGSRWARRWAEGSASPFGRWVLPAMPLPATREGGIWPWRALREAPSYSLWSSVNSFLAGTAAGQAGRRQRPGSDPEGPRAEAAPRSQLQTRRGRARTVGKKEPELYSYGAQGSVPGTLHFCPPLQTRHNDIIVCGDRRGQITALSIK